MTTTCYDHPFLDVKIALDQHERATCPRCKNGVAQTGWSTFRPCTCPLGDKFRNNSMRDLFIAWHNEDEHEELHRDILRHAGMCPACNGSGIDPDPALGWQHGPPCPYGCQVPVPETRVEAYDDEYACVEF